jgi:nuclear autoantigenic sperm protein
VLAYLSSAKYGELDPRCAEVYFYYGRALLELARVENTVLGNALNGGNVS